MALGINYKNTWEIDVNPGGSPQWETLGAGTTNVTHNLNEVLYQASYIDDEGWGSTEVTGAQLTMAFTGARKYEDAAQNFIFSDAVKYNFGDARKTTMRVLYQNGDILSIPVTIVNPIDKGGDANVKSDMSFELHGNGRPVLTLSGLLGSLTVVSVSGTSGKTKVYVNPAVTSLHSYKYKLATTAVSVSYDEVATTGWSTWDGTAEITATTGQVITIVEVLTADNKVKKTGSQTVTAG